MKYINKFSTNADYQAFTEGGGYVTPNVCYVEETDGIVIKPYIPPILIFTIDGIEYQYEEGMTWEKWVNSDYNIDGYIIIEEQAVSGIHKHISLNNRKVDFQRSNGTLCIAVEYTDIIDSNYIYGLSRHLEPH
jgi:hypothetical protein